MEKLFSYGTLQLERVQIETFGRKLVGSKDVLLCYQLSEIEITDQSVVLKSGLSVHPILRYTGNSNDEVEGVVFEVTEEELSEADKYEVKEYERRVGQFKSGESAWIYAEAVGLDKPNQSMKRSVTR